MMKPDSAEPRQVFLAAMGDANDPLTWSGIPYYFLQAGRRDGLIDAGLPLTREGMGFHLRRLLWNGSRVLAGKRHGGYQYTRGAVRNLWRPTEGTLEGSAIINCFQLFPENVVNNRGIARWHYLDMPLRLLWDFYGGLSLDRHVQDEIIKRERDAYHTAGGLIANSQWAARSLERDYGIPRGKIRIVLQSASLDAEVYARWEAAETERRAGVAASDSPLRLLFVGRDWPRKGLDRLLRGLAIARSRGSRAQLRVIGCEFREAPPELQAIEGVEWLGVVNKRTDAARFLQLMSECDVGCLLSRKEAGGVCLREFLAMGMAAIGPDVGGAPEQLHPGTSILLGPDAPDEEVAEAITGLEKQPERLAAMRAKAWACRRQGLWSHAIAEIHRFWPYPVNMPENAGNPL